MLDVYTNHSNFVCVVSNGTAVLGLGDIGAVPPCRSWKANLCCSNGFGDGTPSRCAWTPRIPPRLSSWWACGPLFGGVNLEDIKAPECFEIEDSLKARGVFKGPIFHDDQHGTAVVTLAGLLNALKIVGKNIEDIKVVTSGAGAAGTAIISCSWPSGSRTSSCATQGPHLGRPPRGHEQV